MRISRYTIIEMLSVIVIGAILVSISIPAFSRMMTGNAPSMAAREIMGKLASARSYAAAQRCYVAVVFPRTESSTNILANFRYTAYRICKVKWENSAFKFQEWLGDWNFMPQGTGITQLFCQPNSSNEREKAKKTGTTENISVAVSISDCYIGDMKGYTASSIKVELKNAIVFNSLGMPVNADNENTSVRIAIMQGVSENNTFTHKEDIKDSNGYCALPLIVRITGKAKCYEELSFETTSATVSKE